MVQNKQKIIIELKFVMEWKNTPPLIKKYHTPSSPSPSPYRHKTIYCLLLWLLLLLFVIVYLLFVYHHLFSFTVSFLLLHVNALYNQSLTTLSNIILGTAIVRESAGCRFPVKQSTSNTRLPPPSYPLYSTFTHIHECIELLGLV
jgi:hypothetical protein